MYIKPNKLHHFTLELWLEMALQLFARYKPTRSSAAPTFAWYQIIDRYNSLQRHYHDLRHIDYCVGQWRKTQGLFREDPYLGLFALIMHDYVYDPSATNNELKSGQAAAELWKAIGLPEKSVPIQKVRNYIEATDHRSSPTTRDEKLVLDIDLASLAVSWANFLKNAEQIRKEYAGVPEEKFLLGRKQILEGFLAKEKIYLTNYFETRFEKKARVNLARAIGVIEEKLIHLPPP